MIQLFVVHVQNIFQAQVHKKKTRQQNEAKNYRGTLWKLLEARTFGECSFPGDWRVTEGKILRG
jgi:hypothetical protein